MVSLVALFLVSKEFGSNSCTYVLYKRIHRHEIDIINQNMHPNIQSWWYFSWPVTKYAFTCKASGWGPMANWDFIDFFVSNLHIWGCKLLMFKKTQISRERLRWQTLLSKESNRIPFTSNRRGRAQYNSLLQCNCLFPSIEEKESISLSCPEKEKSDKSG